MQLNRIYHEDCLVGLKQITTESIDLVVTFFYDRLPIYTLRTRLETLVTVDSCRYP